MITIVGTYFNLKKKSCLKWLPSFSYLIFIHSHSYSDIFSFFFLLYITTQTVELALWTGLLSFSILLFLSSTWMVAIAATWLGKKLKGQFHYRIVMMMMMKISLGITLWELGGKLINDRPVLSSIFRPWINEKPEVNTCAWKGRWVEMMVLCLLPKTKDLVFIFPWPLRKWGNMSAGTVRKFCTRSLQGEQGQGEGGWQMAPSWEQKRGLGYATEF